MAPTRLNNKGTRKRRGRPSLSQQSGATTTTKAKTASSKKLSRKRPTLQREAEDELSITHTNRTLSSGKRQRAAPDEDNEIAPSPRKSQKKYVQLEIKTKRIPQEQIQTWPQVSSQVFEQIATVIHTAKLEIANTQRDDQKIDKAHRALNPFVKKLRQQLATMRVPPQAKDLHFNVDKLTERNAQISREMTAARHAQQLLNEQVEVAEKLLGNDEKNLEQLKLDAKQWQTEWKQRQKRGHVHPLLQDTEGVKDIEDGPDAINLMRSRPVDYALINKPDTELDNLMEQLRRSLENMQGNHVQVEGVDAAIRNAQVALDEVLYKHANSQQYAAF